MDDLKLYDSSGIIESQSPLKLFAFCLIDQVAASFNSRRRTRKRTRDKAMLHPEADENGGENINSGKQQDSHRV